MTTLAKKVSVIIPTLNEEKGIKNTILSIQETEIHKLGYDLEILVIDGNSNDLTREIALQMGAKVIIEREKGYGLAYKIGLKAASGDIIVTMDGDGTYPAHDIPNFILQLEDKDLDFITIDRLSKMEKGMMSITHMVGNKILSKTLQLLYSVNIKDSQSGMWIMKKSFVERINLHSDDMSMSEEIKIIAFKFFKALEIEGKYYRRIGKAKLETFAHGWKNLRFLFRYRTILSSAYSSIIKSEKQVESVATVREVAKAGDTSL